MNNVILIGRLTGDPETRYTAKTQTAVTTFTVAVDRPTKEKETDFIRVKVFGKQAETCEKYSYKGQKIAIAGSIQTGSYEKNGETVYTTDVVANRVEFLEFGSKKKEDAEFERVAAEVPEEVIDQEVAPGDSFEQIDADIPF